MPFGGIWCCYIWYGTVLRSQQSMIIHEHDENSWQRLFTVRSLPDAHHPVHGTLGNQDIYDSWNCQLFFEAHKKEFLYKLIIVFVTLHRGAFCHFPFRWIYYYESNKSTGEKTGQTHLCALSCPRL